VGVVCSLWSVVDSLVASVACETDGIKLNGKDVERIYYDSRRHVHAVCPCVLQVRDQKGIEGGFIGDLITVCCCYCCTVVQEAQEVQAIGSMNMARQ